MNEARAVMHDLARHGSTAQFLATKLVRHFMADEPPAEAIDRIARVFRKTDGDLVEVSRALEIDDVMPRTLRMPSSHLNFREKSA